MDVPGFRHLDTCIVRDGENYFTFKVSRRIGDLVMVSFEPGNGAVQAHIDGDRYYFETGIEKYRWVAELKPEHGQRAANDLAAQTARVGLAESEWMRRYNP